MIIYSDKLSSQDVRVTRWSIIDMRLALLFIFF